MKKQSSSRVEHLNKKLKFNERYSADSLAKGQPDQHGSWFLNQFGNIVDLSSVLLVGACVDTVRQLYNGVLDEGFLLHLETLLQHDEAAKVSQCYPSAKLPLGEFLVSKMGKASGYRYKLQNNEIGVVVLVGSYYCKPDSNGAHLKIECSPHFIALHTADILQERLDAIARSILHDFDYQGVAVHLASDLQGWRPGADFFDRFVTYARFVRNYLGLATAEIGQGFQDVAAQFGGKDTETITIGKPSGLQTSIYNKTKQSRVVDKVDYYRNLWRIHSLGQYDPEGPDVYRVEYRFHHSVVKELEIDGKSGIVNFRDVSKVLNNLWKYAVLRNRLDSVKNHIDPVWQLLLDDVRFTDVPPYGVLKRVKKNDLSAIGKNIELLLGNFMSIYARKSDDIKGFFEQLRALRVYQDILDYYRIERKIGEDEFRDKCKKALVERRLRRNAA